MLIVHFLSFSRKVIGRKVSAGKTVKVNVMWTQMIVPTNIRIFMPNHFVALREIGSEPIQQIIIDVTKIVAPRTLGRKPAQKKTKNNERTISLKRRKKDVNSTEETEVLSELND